MIKDLVIVNAKFYILCGLSLLKSKIVNQKSKIKNQKSFPL